MRTSKAQQAETRARIVRCAVALMSREGYDAVTMKDVARAAKIGDSTIYKYFPSKERLILGYFDLVAEEAIAARRDTPDIDGYDLQSRLQRLTDAVLERLEPDRRFVEIARPLVAKAPLLLLGDKMVAKRTLKDVVHADLEHAVASNEIPPSDFLRLMSGLYVDYCLGVIAYWLADASPERADTTRFVDQTLGIVVAVLKAGLPDRVVELGLFVVRSQFARLVPSAHSAGFERTSDQDDEDGEATPGTSA